MPLAIGQILQSRYRILRLLGQGGMGAVYLAEDARLGRQCAVKENVPDPSANPQVLAQMRQQFQVEARTLAALDHPNLPKVYDFFSDSGNEYIVMEYVEGEDLAILLQRQGGPLPERPVLLWVDQALDALEELHSQQPRPIIHRDIKPANIILTAKGRIKLVDFGLVKLLDPSNPSTATSMKGMGTPEYAPLEQYGKGAGHTDARSDIYSLGATLYHLLTNVAPPEVTQRILDPRQLAPPRQCNPALSPATEAAVLKAIEIHPDQRWQTAAELRQALASARPPPASGGTASSSSSGHAGPWAPPASPAVKRSPAAQRWPWPLAAIGGALLLVALLLVFWPKGASPAATATPTVRAIAPATATPAPVTATRPPTVTLAPASLTPAPPTVTPLPLTARPATATRPPAIAPTQARLTSAPPAAALSRFGIALVLVPAGQFTMGSTAAEVDAAFELCQKAYSNCPRAWFENEQPRHEVDLPAFWIGKTEVTNAQYRPFVEAGGYRDQVLWTAAGWEWRSANNVTQPSCWTDSAWNKPDYPVVCVAWYEALAYTRWLGRETGLAVRLPTTAEWEAAARGADARAWPWGNQAPDGSRLNFCDKNCQYNWKDSGVDDRYATTAPVGSYPAGASPYDALDMAGNVWEWTSTLWGGCDSTPRFGYPYRPDDGREKLEDSGCRVVRGGAWNNQLANARPARWLRDDPSGRNNNLGLRVVVAPQ